MTAFHNYLSALAFFHKSLETSSVYQDLCERFKNNMPYKYVKKLR